MTESMQSISNNSKLQTLLFLFVLLLRGSLGISQEIVQTNFYNQDNHYRMAAEWEPALGTLIAWPLSIPYKLVVELAADNSLFTLVENESSKMEALKWFGKWGIDTDRVTFITAPQGIDVSWVRDWGPHAVFPPQGKMKLADGKYIFSTPVTTKSCTDPLMFLYMDGDKILKTETEDNATAYIGNALNLEILDLPFISTGGNVMTDGLGSAYSSCILNNENRYYGVTDDMFFKENKMLLGINKYHILSNFEKTGIQHIDCLMKLLDEERILVMQPPSDHELFPVYEDIVKNELSQFKTYYGRPYEIVRMNTFRYRNDDLAAYSNSLILNKTIYVPLFGIPGDVTAMRRWKELMPGYTVKGFEYILNNEPSLTQQIKDRYQSMGWNHGDALHCRTRAIWDPDMLFIALKTANKSIKCGEDNQIYATIIDYSGKGLKNDSLIMYWRIEGNTIWNEIRMKNTDIKQQYEVQIPCQNQGISIEYYISGASESGKKATRPSTAPLGYYRTTFK